METLNKMNNIGISGVIKMGKSGDPVLGIPVVDEMVGIAVVGGINRYVLQKRQDLMLT